MTPKTVLYRILPNFHDFGNVYMSDIDIALYDMMVARRLPDEVEWTGDELIVDCDSDLLMEDFEAIWNEITNAAWEEFCALCTTEDFKAAGEKYEVDVPDGYTSDPYNDRGSEE